MLIYIFSNNGASSFARRHYIFDAWNYFQIALDEYSKVRQVQYCCVNSRAKYVINNIIILVSCNRISVVSIWASLLRT